MSTPQHFDTPTEPFSTIATDDTIILCQLVRPDGIADYLLKAPRISAPRASSYVDAPTVILNQVTPQLSPPASSQPSASASTSTWLFIKDVANLFRRRFIFTVVTVLTIFAYADPVPNRPFTEMAITFMAVVGMMCLIGIISAISKPHMQRLLNKAARKVKEIVSSRQTNSPS